MSRFLLIILFFLFSTSLGMAQTKEQLQKKKEQLLKEIKNTQELLKTTKNNKQNSLAELNAVNKELELRKKVIQTSQSQVNLFNKQIIQSNEEVKKKTAELEQLKKEYAQAVVQTYKYNKFSDKLLFILNAKSFSESFRRINYLRQYAIHREKQAKDIADKTNEIKNSIAELNKKKEEKVVVLSAQLEEKKDLDKTQLEKNKIVANLKQEESKLQATLANKQKEAKKLDTQIATIIKKEIEAAKKAAELAAKKAAEEAAKKAALEKEKNKTTTSSSTTTKTTTTSTPVKPTFTPEYTKLSSSFMSNKGKLPWPVEKGYISKSFGKYNHPDLSGVIIENNGIDIHTEANSSVRCIFEGTVVGIIDNPVFQNAVIISHGEYFTVYSKLGNVTVSKGQKVSTKQTIGSVYSDIDNHSEVHLEVWKGSDKLNPALWIYAK